jgi:hypothetical protein
VLDSRSAVGISKPQKSIILKRFSAHSKSSLPLELPATKNHLRKRTANSRTLSFLRSLSAVRCAEVVLECWILAAQWEIPQEKCVLMQVSAWSNKPITCHCGLSFQQLRTTSVFKRGWFSTS